MEVTFTKAGESRYTVTVVRDVGLELAPDQMAPGYDPYLPHDIVHFVVEAEAGIRHGVFGRIAAGDSTIFWPTDPRERKRLARRRKQRGKPPESAEEQADVARSERLADMCRQLWEVRSGRPAYRPRSMLEDAVRELNEPVVERILARFDEIGPRWHALPVGGAIALTWPYPEVRRPPRNASRSRRETPRRRLRRPAR